MIDPEIDPDIIQVTAAIIKKGNKVLIAKRKKGMHLGGLWEFPGGKIENGETPEDCLKRELKEEFDINVNIESYLTSNIHQYDRGTINLMAYNVQYVAGEFMLSDHDEIKWVEIKEMENYPFAPADIPIIKELL